MHPILRSVLTSLLCLAVSAPALHAETASADLGRYVGTYEIGAGQKLHVFRDGSDLKAQPDGQPVTTLKAERQPGRFSFADAPISVEFLEDKAGVVTAIEFIAPNGATRRFRRLVDARDADAAASFHAFEVGNHTSVHARVFNGYTRPRAPDGSYPVETYALGNGGFSGKAAKPDSAADGRTFKTIVSDVAPLLARQNYLPGSDPAKTKLLVMIYWGNNSDGSSATLPGGADHPAKDELEKHRDWVALCAFDFQTARADKKMKLLWTVRYNVPGVSAGSMTAAPQ